MQPEVYSFSGLDPMLPPTPPPPWHLRGEAGNRATVSHTGSIAGWDAAYEAVFAKYAIASASDMSEAIAILGLLATCERKVM